MLQEVEVMKTMLLVLAFLRISVAQEVLYSVEKQLDFVNTNIAEVLGMIVNASLPYPEINERVKRQDAQIALRFGDRKVNTILVPLYHPLQKRIMSTSGISKSGAPEIALYIPRIMDDYNGEKHSLIALIMHERDHLTAFMRDERGLNLGVETQIQAMTMEFVIVPLKEKYGVPVSRNDERHYAAWLKAGRDKKSMIWRFHIEGSIAPAVPKKYVPSDPPKKRVLSFNLKTI